MKYELQISELHAMSILAPKSDVRYYLNGVAVNRGHLVTTDGVILGALPLPEYGGPDIIIPIETIQTLLKITKKGSINLHINGFEHMLITDTGVQIKFTPIDCIYPNWTNLIPPEIEPSVVHDFFNWEQVVKFSRAAKILGDSSKCVRLITNGKDMALIKITCRPDFKGVIMPKCGDAG